MTDDLTLPPLDELEPIPTYFEADEVGRSHFAIHDATPPGAPEPPAPIPLFPGGPAPADELPVLDYRVVYNDRTFEIEEPDIHTICKIISILGGLFLRAERTAGSHLKGLFMSTVGGADGRQKQEAMIPFEALIAAVMYSIEPADIVRLSIVCLFGGKDAQLREGEEWFKAMQRAAGSSSGRGRGVSGGDRARTGARHDYRRGILDPGL